MLGTKTERHYGVLIFSLGAIILFQSLAIGHDASRLEQPALTILMPFEMAPAGPEPKSLPPVAASTAPAAAPTSEAAVHDALSQQGLFVEAAAPPVEDTTYTMQKGDVFFGVAARFGLSATELAAANGLVRPWAPTGTVLRIPRQRPVTVEETVQAPEAIQMSYKVRPGDTLANIASRFYMNVSDLMTENRLLDGKEPAAGKTLVVKIPPVFEYKVGSGESLWKVSKTYEVALSTLVELNDLALADLKPGQVIKIPVSDPSLLDRVWREKNPQIAAKAAAAVDNGKFKFPVAGRITDRYGSRIHPIHGGPDFHEGLDIAAPSGSPIRASRPGLVEFAGVKAGYGRVVVVRHTDGTETWYAHCSKLLAKRGARVKAGTTLARVGSSGSATGPHLHFEIRRNQRPVNPLKYLRG